MTPVSSDFRTANGADLSEVKVVFFDAVGTLIHLPRGVGFHYAEVAQRFGLTCAEDDINTAFMASWKAMPAPAKTDGPRPDDDKGWWREVVEGVLTRIGAREIDREAFFEELYAEFARPGVWALFPEVRSVLEALHGRLELGILSNFDGRLRPVLGHLGIADFFAHLVISSEVGADKPDPRIFAVALARAAVPPSAALHVGDDPEHDWLGAERVGMHVFRLARPATDLRPLMRMASTLP